MKINNTDHRPTKTIIKYGYEYTLVEVGERLKFSIDTPKFMGNYGWALQSFKKVNK